MRTRLLTSGMVFAIGVAGFCIWASTPLLGQAAQGSTSRPAASGRAALPRTADGHPDLQGVYDVATLTPLERPEAFGTSLNMPTTQAERLEQAVDRKIAGSQAMATARPRRLAAMDRRAPPGTSAATTTSGSTTAKSMSRSTARSAPSRRPT
jgi:hypothetical protein